MSMVIAGVMLHPNFLALVTSGEAIHFLGLPVKAVKYNACFISETIMNQLFRERCGIKQMKSG